MNDLLDDDDAPLARNERELTLSTGAILGIFLGLVLLCGACFGVGYNMGRKSTPTPLALNDAPSGDSLDTSGASKPPAGSPYDNAAAAASAPAAVAPPPAPKPAPVIRRTPPVTTTTDDSVATPAAARTPPTPAPAVRAVPPSALLPGSPASASTATSGAGQTGRFMVQIAAVSHQEDADLLVGALRARGYTVSARPSAADTFIHVQVGPFGNKKDADAMRQRLLADGYNAIVK